MSREPVHLPRTVAEFAAQAYALEAEAAERYAELADLMRTHHNAPVAALFDKLAHLEGLHRDKLRGRLMGPAPGDAGAFRWQTPEGPETTDYADLHYLMTPWHALKLAEHNEQRAVAFFEHLAVADVPEDVRAEALEMVADEREHVRLVQEWLAKLPEPGPGWDEDPDPPNVVD